MSVTGFKKLAAIAVLAGTAVLGVAAPAEARDRDDRRGGHWENRDRHDRGDRHWNRGHDRYYYPPVVYHRPPPRVVYYGPSPYVTYTRPYYAAPRYYAPPSSTTYVFNW